MSAPAKTTILIIALLGGGCAPKKAVQTNGASPAPIPSLGDQPSSDLETHRQQVLQDTEAFLAHRNQQATEPTIEWTMPSQPGTTTSTTLPTVVDVQPNPPHGPIEEPVAAPAPATTKAPSSSEDDLHRTMIDFSRELYVNSTWSDQPLKELLVLASLSMLDPERAIDPNAIPDLTDEERALLALMQKYFIAIGNDIDSETNPWLTMSTATTELQRRLKQTPDLEMPTLALCTRVGGFGDFDEWMILNDMDQYSFIAHTKQPVIIYLEMEGFTSNLNDKDLWETVTSQHLTIYSDRDGIPVWKEDWQSASDQSRKRRRDYFTVQKFDLPRGLSVGRYQLKVRVRDEKTGAETEQNIPFTMTAGILD